MHDPLATHQELMKENAALKQKIHALELLLDAAHKQTEKRLHETEERFWKIFQESPVGIAFLDENREIFMTNQRYQDFLGYTEAEIMERGPVGLLHPDDWEPSMEMSKKLRSGEIPLFHMEQRYIRKDGTIVWADTHITVLRDEHGRLLHTIGWVKDITENKRAEEEALRSRAFLDYIIDNAPHSMWISDEQGTLIRLNKMCRDWLKIADDEVVGKYNILKDNIVEGQGYLPLVRQVFDEGKTVRFTIDYDTSKLSNVTLEQATHTFLDVTISPFISQNGEITNAIIQHLDITERVHTMEAKSRTEKRYRNLFSRASEGIMIMDTEGKLLEINESFARMHGYSVEEMLRMNLRDLDTPETDRRVQERRGPVLAGELLTFEVEHFHKEGHVIPLEVSASLISSGEESYILCFHRDITDRKRAEREMAILVEVGQVIGSTLDIEAVYEHFASITNRLIPFDALTVNLIDVPNHVFRIAYHYGHRIPGLRVGLDIPLIGSMTEFVMQKQKTMIFNASSVEEITQLYPGITRILSIQSGFYSNMLIPLFSNDAVIGVLHFRAKTRNTYHDAERSLAERIGMQIAGAIANAQLFNDLSTTERSLRVSEERFRTLMEQAAVGLAEIDRNTGRFLTVNHRLCTMVGRTVEEMLATTLDEITYSEDLHRYREKTALLLVGEIESCRLEMRYIRKDGPPIWVNVTVSFLCRLGEKSERNMIVVEDITARRQAEEEKRRSQEKAERLADEMAIIAEIGRVVGSTLDVTHVFKLVDDELRKLISYDRLLVNLRKSDTEFIVVYSSGIENPLRKLADSHSIQGTTTGVVMSTRKGILIQPVDAEEIKEEFPNLYETFKMGLRSTMTIPLISVNEVIGSLTFRSKALNAYDEWDLRLAERIGMQIAGAIANAQLFSNLCKTEKTLRESEERLRRAEKMEVLGQLAGGVAHDLNNVLGVLSGYSELLLEEMPEGSRPRAHAEKILQSTEKGAIIIQDLLTLARRGVMMSAVIHLNGIILEFLKTPVFEKLKVHHPMVKFRTTLDPNLLNIKGSPIHLEKTLMNLISNAAESISGDGEVMIRTESVYLDRPLRGYDEVKEGEYAVLTVSDTGMGIPAENREKIFEPFYTKKAMGRSGTGLGLAIVWGSVKDHNGYIDVETEVGEGTTFTLYFPVTREELSGQQLKEPIEHYTGHGESVLVVDDISEQREVAVGLLTRLGYHVQVASSGEEAVEYLKINKADILILDMIMLPGMDGLETYKRILEINQKQKAIIVSGFSETERVKEAQKLGAGPYIKKPYILEKIGVAVRDELNRSYPQSPCG